MGHRSNRVLIIDGVVLTLTSSWGAGGEFAIALLGPEDFIRHLREHGEKNGYLHDDVWCEGSILVNYDEKYAAFGMWLEHFYSDSDIEKVSYRDENEHDRQSFWADYWFTLRSIIESAWPGWKIFICNPEDIAIKGRLASLKQLEISSYFNYMGGTRNIYISHLNSLLQRYVSGFDEHFEIHFDDGFFSHQIKTYDWSSEDKRAESEFAEVIEMFNEMCLAEEDRFIASSQDGAFYIQGKADEEPVPLNINLREANEERLKVVETVLSSVLPKTKLTREYVNSPES